MPPNPATTPSTSSRKRKAPCDDNGDPVQLPTKKPKEQSQKKPETSKQKLAAVSKASKSNIPTESAAKRRVKYVELEEIVDLALHPKSNPPRNPNRILEAASSDHEDYNEPPPPLFVDPVDGDDDDDTIEILEEPEQDDEEKLR
jgi:hypothetical protein